MNDKGAKFPVSIEVGATASLEVKTEIPAASTGRFVDSLTDMIRPFTEARGLRADQIRLQRAEVAIEIARLARQRLEIENQPIVSVPNKVLVPLIEKASNEDISDAAMVERWANLLASASSEESIPPVYVQVLSEMNGEQVAILEQIMLNAYSEWYLPYRVFVDSSNELASGIGRRFFREDLNQLNFNRVDDIHLLLIDYFNRPGGYLHYIFDATQQNDVAIEVEVPELFGQYRKNLELNLEICCALGLLKMDEQSFAPRLGGERHEVSITYFRLTSMGSGLLEACARNSVGQLKRSQEDSMKEYESDPRFEDRTCARRKTIRTELSYLVR